MAAPRPAPLSLADPKANASSSGSSTNSTGPDSEPPSPTYPYPYAVTTNSAGASPPVTPRSLSFLAPNNPSPREHHHHHHHHHQQQHTSASGSGPYTPPAAEHHHHHHNTSGSFTPPAVATPPATVVGNPFSPPASVRSFSAGGGGSPSLPLASLPPMSSLVGGADSPNSGSYAHATSYPFGTPGSTRASSLVDVPRAFSTYSIGGERERSSLSRPTTATTTGGAPTPGGLTAGAAAGATGTPKREAFASPPARPLTIYAHPSGASSTASGTPGARALRNRPKSTAILLASEASSTTTLPASGSTSSSTNTSDADLSEKPDGLVQRGKKGEFAGGKAGSTRPSLLRTLDKPWIGKRDPWNAAAYWVTWIMIFAGFAIGGARMYLAWRNALLLKVPLCPVLLEDFTNTTTEQLFGTGIAGEGGIFFREVDASGFGNGEFEMTTASDGNSFVHNGQLYLLPTLTSDVIPESNILDGTIYNLTDCTYNITHSTGYTTEGHGSAGINSTEGTSGKNGGGIAPDAPLDLHAYLSACSAYSNATQGKILPPVMSARISTRRSASLKFGRVEVRAKIPTGDWLWPAIWMLPVDNVYGSWPLSGEIDIMEARGNGPSYPKQGVNYVRSSLNWGPTTFLNKVAKTYGWWLFPRGRYDDGFHTYALEWTEDFIRMYVDTRLQVMYLRKITSSFWDLGDFPPVVQNGTDSVVLSNPWINGTKAAPFDQRFYLIMNVAVGGTNGWFPDGPEKPWLDGSSTAPLDFLKAKDKWYPSWPQDPFKRAMVIDSVKMWEQCQG